MLAKLAIHSKLLIKLKFASMIFPTEHTIFYFINGYEIEMEWLALN